MFIEVENLSKKYLVYERKGIRRVRKEIQAVNNISFSFDKGDFIGYIGPNGAGKSTTIKMLTGILFPDKGKILIGNEIPFQNRKKYVKNIGVVFGQRTQMWWDLPVIDTFNLLIPLYGVKKEEGKKRIKALTERLQISDFLNQPVRQLSLGQRMRAELACCLIHDPQILFLDEPTIGLDVVSKHIVFDLLREVNSEGKTIFFTSHDLKDIETLCEKLLVINFGKVIFDGNVQEFKKNSDFSTILKIRIKNNELNSNELEYISSKNGKWFPQLREVQIPVTDENKTPSIIKELFSLFEINSFVIDEPPIEKIVKQVFLKKISSEYNY